MLVEDVLLEVDEVLKEEDVELVDLDVLEDVELVEVELVE